MWSKDLPVPLVLYMATTVSYSSLSGRSITFSQSMVLFVRSGLRLRLPSPGVRDIGAVQTT
jgi:hypothetical protein